jgi:hypothetical protein
MKKWYLFAFTLMALMFYCFPSRSQGCSDAGFCTMGAMKPDQPFKKNIPLRLRSMELSFYRGTTTLSPIVYVSTLDVNFNIIDDKTFFQIKVPYQMVKGNLGKTSALSDISLCFTRNVFTIGEFDIHVSLGGKIPANDANLKDDVNNLPLPMYYQTSLGTYDVIAGLSVMSRNWLFATGIQHPFNRTGNHFTWAPWIPVYKNGEDPGYVQSYNGAYELKRGTDVMLRAERNFRFSRVNFSLGVLPIFRINRDEITDVKANKRVRPEGAIGMAFSAIATAGYSFNTRSGIKLLYGRKLRSRQVNPDGLTRHDVMTFTYFYRF